MIKTRTLEVAHVIMYLDSILPIFVRIVDVLCIFLRSKQTKVILKQS